MPSEFHLSQLFHRLSPLLEISKTHAYKST
jgi:hypothetical protein